jgi:hypothetical protein
MDAVDRSFLHFLANEPRSLGCPALSLVAILSGQSQLHWRVNEEVMDILIFCQPSRNCSEGPTVPAGIGLAILITEV